MSQLLYANNASTTLSSGLNSSATSITVASGAGSEFPNPSAGQFFIATLVDAATGLYNEIVYVTARSGDTMTVVRAQEGTVARSWLVGDTFANFWTAGSTNTFFQGQTYAGNPNGHVAGNAGTAGGAQGIVPDILWDSTNNVIWACTTSGPATTAVWVNCMDPGSLLSANGYQKFANGLIDQWGSTAVSANTQTSVTLPTPFATSAYSLQVTADNSGTTTVSAWGYKVNGSTISVCASYNGTVDWRVIGK